MVSRPVPPVLYRGGFGDYAVRGKRRESRVSVRVSVFAFSGTASFECVSFRFPAAFSRRSCLCWQGRDAPSTLLSFRPAFRRSGRDCKKPPFTCGVGESPRGQVRSVCSVRCGLLRHFGVRGDICVPSRPSSPILKSFGEGRKGARGKEGGLFQKAPPPSPAKLFPFPISSPRRGYWGGGYRGRGRRAYRKRGTCRSRGGRGVVL